MSTQDENREPEYCREGITTLGELKAFLDQLRMPDEAPVWLGNTVVEGGCDYPHGYRRYEVNVMTAVEEFGIALPEGHPRRVKEEGVVIW